MKYKWSCWRCEEEQETESSPLDMAQCKKCSRPTQTINSKTSTALELIVFSVCVFVLFLNCISFVASVAHKDPMLNEKCNSKIPYVMFMYHFGCYITGNTYR